MTTQILKDAYIHISALLCLICEIQPSQPSCLGSSVAQHSSREPEKSVILLAMLLTRRQAVWYLVPLTLLTDRSCVRKLPVDRELPWCIAGGKWKVRFSGRLVRRRILPWGRTGTWETRHQRDIRTTKRLTGAGLRSYVYV